MATATASDPAKCAACPVAGADCVGFVCRRVCELVAAGRSDYRDEALRRAGEAPPLPPPTPSEWDRVDTCLYRGCQDGCREAVCHAGRSNRFGLVDVYECLACLGGQSPYTSAFAIASSTKAASVVTTSPPRPGA